MVSFGRCFKNSYIKFTVLKGDGEIKFRRRIFRVKFLIYV